MPPFRIGTTSYIIPDDILPNVTWLAGRVRDVELVLFDIDDGQNNLPSPDVVRELRRLAECNDLTYTVHLPLDLKLGADGSDRDTSIEKARKVIECTAPLSPWAYVVHLDGRSVLGSADDGALARWRLQAAKALETVASWTRGPEHLAVENLDRYPPRFNDGVLSMVDASRCVDVGHLWLDGHDPVAYLSEWLPRTRVIHVHGIAERDHASLTHVPEDRLKAVLRLLVERNYCGALTIEVFGEDDFHTSMTALRKAGAGLWQDD